MLNVEISVLSYKTCIVASSGAGELSIGGWTAVEGDAEVGAGLGAGGDLGISKVSEEIELSDGYSPK
jgi:hypothetical protein